MSKELKLLFRLRRFYFFPSPFLSFEFAARLILIDLWRRFKTNFALQTFHLYLFRFLFYFWNLDDPYYCGLRARVPNFVKSSKNKGKDSVSPMKRISVSNLQHPAASLASLHQLHQMHPQHLYASHHPHPQYPQNMMLHTRSFESGIGESVWYTAVLCYL